MKRNLILPSFKCEGKIAIITRKLGDNGLRGSNARQNQKNKNLHTQWAEKATAQEQIPWTTAGICCCLSCGHDSKLIHQMHQKSPLSMMFQVLVYMPASIVGRPAIFELASKDPPFHFDREKVRYIPIGIYQTLARKRENKINPREKWLPKNIILWLGAGQATWKMHQAWNIFLIRKNYFHRPLFIILPPTPYKKCIHTIGKIPTHPIKK